MHEVQDEIKVEQGNLSPTAITSALDYCRRVLTGLLASICLPALCRPYSKRRVILFKKFCSSAYIFLSFLSPLEFKPKSFHGSGPQGPLWSRLLLSFLPIPLQPPSPSWCPLKMSTLSHLRSLPWPDGLTSVICGPLSLTSLRPLIKWPLNGEDIPWPSCLINCPVTLLYFSV